jgi:hypothetical protein
MKKFAILIVFLWACAWHPFAWAGDDRDRIEVRASSYGYPPPGAGWDVLNIELRRPSDRNHFKDSAVEKLFAEVEGILKKRKIKDPWGWVLVDFPYVSIEIELNGKKISLASSHPYIKPISPTENSVFGGTDAEGCRPAQQPKTGAVKIEENCNGKQAFDEIYAAIRRYVNAQMLIQRE